MNGHSLTCCKSNTTAGRFQGFYEPEIPDDKRAATKMKEMEINMNMMQLKLLLNNSEAILRQAKELDLPLCDCVVVFDIRNRPIEVEVKKYTDVYVRPEHIKKSEESRSKENITFHYYSSIYIGKREGYVADCFPMSG